MSLDKSKAGKIGRCLRCNQKFRVPIDADDFPDEDSPLERPPASARAADPSIHPQSKAPQGREPLPPKTDADIISREGYGLAQDESAPVQAKNRRPTGEEADDTWEDLDAVSRERGGRDDDTELADEDDDESGGVGPESRRRRRSPGSLIAILISAAVVVLGSAALIVWIVFFRDRQ
jgi:hypothetical protein